MPHKVADPANAVDPTPNSFGENLRRLRKRLDLTQDELAKRTGCARVTIRKVEADEMRPSKQLAELLAQALDIPVAERGAFVQFARGSQRMEERKGPEPGPTDATVYRRTFVGREGELRQVRDAFDGALAGYASLLMVVGEPGVGKSALCEQLAAYVTQHGGCALVGHCYEEGSLSLPYLPFVEAMRSYVLTREPADLKQQLSTSAADVARIVPEIRERVDVVLRNGGDPEAERYRLLQAVTTFLRNASASQPLLVVLEDLHWADRGTLDLLAFIARSFDRPDAPAAGARLLIVGTYRDVEVNRAHPLAAALAELRRAGGFPRILLRGLTAAEVQRMLSSIAGQEVSLGLAEAVHRQTEGNPLFIQEVVRYLAEEGLISREGDRWRSAGQTPLAMHIPEGLRDVIGKRLSHLSPDCNRLLSIAAVMGRDFAPETLQAIAAMPEGRLFEALAEAVRVDVLAEQSHLGVVRYRFTHAFFRQTLYEEMIAPRRIRLHQQIARALETQYAARLPEHAAELSEHFAHSSDPADLTKAIAYGELAAQRAVAVYAYSEAARLLERTLEVQQVLDPDDRAKRCEMLLALGDALLPAGGPKRVVDEIAPEAFALAEAMGDRHRCWRACRLVRFALLRFGNAASLVTPASERWLERADRYAAPGTAERVYADNWLAGTRLLPHGQFAQGWALLVRAFELASQLDDPEALAFAVVAILAIFPQAPQQPELQLRLAEEFTARLQEKASGTRLHYGCFLSGLIYLEFAQRQRAEAVWRQLPALAQRTQDAVAIIWSLVPDALLAALDGELESALAVGAHIIARADELGSPAMGRHLINQSSSRRALLYLGRADEALAAVPAATQLFGVANVDIAIHAAPHMLCLAYAGHRAEAQTALWQFINERGIGTEHDEAPMPDVQNLLETAVLVEDREATALLLPRLEGFAPMIDGWYLTCIARHLGAAAALLGDKPKAMAHNQQALEVVVKVRFRPEIALTRLQMAELLLDETDAEKQAEARAHLDFAIDEFRAMKMQPALDRALSDKVRLEA